LSEFPQLKREYRALEVSYHHSGGDRYYLLASYVLSENRGNYSGFFFSDGNGGGPPNLGPAFDVLESTVDGDGLLPNDRTHVFKVSGSYRIGLGLTVGAMASWMSGTPLNEFGSALFDALYPVFLVPRGEAGRMPSIWDLNFRVAYDLSALLQSRMHPRIIVDLLHVGSPREPVLYDQRHYLERDDQGNHVAPNPTYGLATAYQPPAAVRFGIEMIF
jgi:hypothetical protein